MHKLDLFRPFFTFQARLTLIAALAGAAIATLLLTGSDPEAYGAAEAGGRIGFVDVALVSSLSQSIQANVKEAEAEMKNEQEKIDLLIQRYRISRAELDARRSVLSEAEFTNSQKNVRDIQDEIELRQLEVNKLLRRIESDIMGPAVDRILQSVRDVAESEGFDLVLTSEVVVHGADALNITPLVVQALDRPGAGGGSPPLP